MPHVIGEFVKSKLGLKTAQQWTELLAIENDCRTAIDIGCGTGSHLTTLRPRITTVGIDSSEPAIEASRAANAHDYYVSADILRRDDIASLLPAEFNGKADIVALYGVIEHLPKALGLELLAKCDALTRKLVLLETPNGFLAQGPEFNNEHMRHLSGWFIHDFEGHGFTVVGTTGTRYLLGYGAGLKVGLPGVGSLDVLLSRALRVDRNPKRAFNLFAYKDVRGVRARMG
jgi:SAM-dependent methyltransferase